MAAPALTISEAFVYGLIQGVTEFLPVSSSGHLAIAHQIGLGGLPQEIELSFDVLLHSATLIAIGIAFRREILAALAWRPRFYICVLLGIVPAGLVGFVAKKYVEAAGNSWWILGASYIFTALFLTIAERVSNKRAVDPDDNLPPHESLDKIKPKQALLVGLVQVIALFPGVSRSGSTIAGGLLGGLRPAVAVSFSFLVGLPLIAAAAGKDAIEGRGEQMIALVGILPLSVAFVTALASGLGSIALLRLVVGKRRLVWFGVYCGLVALFCFGRALREYLSPGWLG